MPWQLTFFSSLSLLVAVACLLVLWLTWRHRSAPHALPFAGLVFALAGWSFFYAVQLGFTTAAEQLVAQRLALAIAAWVPLTWLLFTLRYANHNDWLTNRLGVAALALHPVSFAVLALTNGSHELLWAVEGFDASVPVVVLDLQPAYLAHITTSYVIIAAGLAVLASVLARGTIMYRKQVWLLILGTLPPFGANVAFSLGVEVVADLDLTPFAFGFTAVAFGLALFHFDLLERTPVARARAIDETGDGLIVAAADGRIVDANEVARAVLDPAPTAGTSTDDYDALPDGNGGEGGSVADGSGTGGRDGNGSDDGTATLTATVDGARRSYDVHRSTLTDHHDRPTGAVYVLRDVTTREAYEQRLEVTNRVLRHNLRNDMNVIAGRAAELESAVDDELAPAVRTIDDTASDLVELAENARLMADVGGPGEATERRVDVASVARAVADESRDGHPDASFAVDAPSSARARVVDEELFERALRNFAENAVEYNDTSAPAVSVTVTTENGQVTVRVADDGPGIPEVEATVFADGSETPLRHSNGLGLWLGYWCATASGGEFRVEDTDPRGTAVTLALPATAPDERET